ncbi:Protein of unknown function [Pyronema omphalodes CBS 100304]|uniref:Uncharacterized protein n=1 Tax=Pyronema omphalodes (strain CBS 100304) TaxID=1076935 RepID=U4LVD3_PYROM|nr:Protein of unknown function [Pyronema omphalodes CBS 100304]
MSFEPGLSQWPTWSYFVLGAICAAIYTILYRPAFADEAVDAIMIDICICALVWKVISLCDQPDYAWSEVVPYLLWIAIVAGLPHQGQRIRR